MLRYWANIGIGQYSQLQYRYRTVREKVVSGHPFYRQGEIKEQNNNRQMEMKKNRLIFQLFGGGFRYSLVYGTVCEPSCWL